MNTTVTHRLRAHQREQDRRHLLMGQRGPIAAAHHFLFHEGNVGRGPAKGRGTQAQKQ
ncbi:hypothetical protein MUN81_15580 [Hymenobacter sp. 5317J-9]|nr:hypothetical protein [Hymenobacter sp. 5317J-9]UOQ96657.1 hypothetical protein MUN81_15580 [Hymenobacter sp. 5317J-9]